LPVSILIVHLLTFKGLIFLVSKVLWPMSADTRRALGAGYYLFPNFPPPSDMSEFRGYWGSIAGPLMLGAAGTVGAGFIAGQAAAIGFGVGAVASTIVAPIVVLGIAAGGVS